jgi:hypothetical protein
MPGFLRQSTASQVRAIGPFIDDTDFKTAKTGLTIANTDIKLVVNGGASANKNSGGGTHRVNGVYGLTFDATDTATVGEIEVSVSVAGALLVFDKFVVVEEAVYDALFVAAAPGYVVDQPVNATKFAGQTITAAAGVTLPSSVASPTNITAATGVVLSSAGVQAIWDALTSALTTVGSIGKRLVDNLTGDIYARLGSPAGASVSADIAAVKTDTAAVKVQTDKLTFTVSNQVDSNVLDWKSSTAPAMTGDAYARLGAPAGASVSADIAAVKVVDDAIKAKTDNLPSDPADASDIATSFGTVNTTLGTIAGYIDTEVAAIKAKTDNLPAAPAAVGDIPTADQNADALLDRSDAIETGLTPRGSFRLAMAALAGKLSGNGTTTVTIRNVGDTKDRITATIDGSKNRTAVSTDVS